MVAPEDIGHFAANLLMNQATGLQFVEGPQHYSPADVAASFSSALGQLVRVATTPESRWLHSLQQTGFSNKAAKYMINITKLTLKEKFEPADSHRGKTTLQSYINSTVDLPFVMEQVYNAPVQMVWQALTDETQMREWYFPALQKFEPVVGFDFKFSNDGSPYQKDWQLTKVEAKKLLAHSWTYKNYPGYSEVTFELFEESRKTRLKLTHTGLASFPKDPHFARQRFEDGWKQILGTNLKNLLSRFN